MSSTLNERVNEVPNIDRLSSLPDSIITRILSFLEVDDSAVTALLSKRWQYLWTQSPKLIFSQGYLEVPSFVALVNRTLITCSRDHLKKFVVDFEYTKPFASDINAWVQFAVNNQVKRVAFFLKTLGNVNDFYVLPQLMCSNSSLVSLAIKGCTIAPQRTIDWPSMTELLIEGVDVQQHIIEKILSGCPLLSGLLLNECWGFNSLEIKSKGLNYIWICDRYNHEGNGPLLEISAPFIQKMTVSIACPERRKLRFTNIPSEVIVNIEFVGCGVKSVELMNNAKELLGNIQHVKVVNLGANCIKVLSSMATEYGYDQFPRSKLRTSLTISIFRNHLDDIHGILGLLESSPNLESLVIEGHEHDYDMEPYNCTSANDDLVSDLLQLKTVIVEDFVARNLAGEPMLTLVRILLKRSPVLEKIVIDDKEIIKSSSALDPFTILKTLLSYPRSSKKASILFVE